MKRGESGPADHSRAMGDRRPLWDEDEEIERDGPDQQQDDEEEEDVEGGDR
jgi:hypothetical protein